MDSTLPSFQFTLLRNMSYAPAAGPSGSRTVTVTGTPSGPSREGSSGPSDQAPPNIGTLRLRGGPDPQYGGSSKGKGKAGEKPKRKGVVWAEEVVDNEGLGKKKSKSGSRFPLSFRTTNGEKRSDVQYVVFTTSLERLTSRRASQTARQTKGTAMRTPQDRLMPQKAAARVCGGGMVAGVKCRKAKRVRRAMEEREMAGRGTSREPYR